MLNLSSLTEKFVKSSIISNYYTSIHTYCEYNKSQYFQL